MPSQITAVQDFDAALPLAQARTIPAAWYSDADIAEAERQQIFMHSWQPVARVEQLEAPGSFVTNDVAGEPIALVRGSDGVLRGIFNVCRHRAAMVLTEPQGCVGKLRCQYHGWTYDLEGRLKGTPEFEGVQEFDKCDNGLVPVGAMGQWGPWVFVHVAPKPVKTLLEALAPMPSLETTKHLMHGLEWRGRKSYDVNCNWKVYVDNYLDGGYHVNTIHPALAGVIDYKEYHIECYDDTVLQHTPLKESEGTVGRTRTGGRAEYWWAFPNFMVNLYSGVMDTNLVIPTSNTSCRVIFDFYFNKGVEDTFVAESISVADTVQEEDKQVCEQVQRGLGSRSYNTGRFSVKREAGGHHFHKRLAEWLRKTP